MPFADNQGIKIHYEVQGQGPPLVLAHGAAGDATFWTDYGYVEALKDQHTVILFDARGHGGSDKPHDVDLYDFRLMVGDVLVVMDVLRVSQAHYWGYSMGGYLGFALAVHAPERLISLIVGGSAPHNPSDRPKPGPLMQVFRQGLDQGADAAIEATREVWGYITPRFEECLRALDFRALMALWEAYQFRPGLEDHLEQMDIPCLVYAGDADEGPHAYGQEAVRHLPNARFYSLAGLDHVGAGSAPERILPQVLAFLADAAERKKER